MSMIAALLLILLGAFLGLAALVGLLVLAFLLFSERAADDVKQDETWKPSEAEVAGTGNQTEEQQQVLHDSIVQEMLERGEKASPPHKHACRGEFSGYVWTIPSSRYNVTEAVVNWPPATEGPKAVATKWWGSLKGGTLYLAKSSGLENSYLVPVLEINLESCEVEVLRQALKSKSRWWRKCPIQVKSTGRPLLHGEPSFALFAEGSAAKEQWYLALKQATGGLSRQAVEDAYRQFCQRVRESGGLYPKEASDSASLELGSKASSLGEAASKGLNQNPKGWGRLFSKRRQSPQKARPGGQSMKHSSPPAKKALPPGFLNPMELDQAWMGKGAISGHLAAPAVAKTQQQRTETEKPGAVSADISDTQSEPVDPASPQSNIDPGNGAAPLEEVVQAVSPKEVDVQARMERLRAGSRSVHFPLPSEGRHSESEDELENPKQPQNKQEGAVPMPVPDRDTKASQYHPVECAVNMLLARVAFDVLRNPDVKQKLIAHIHRKVNELRFPSYIHGIEVVDINLGAGVPMIHNLQAMPTPGNLIWPQLLLDFEYEGDIKIILETKLDVRDGAAWSQFDKALERLEGGAEEEEIDDALVGDSDEDVTDLGALSPVSPLGTSPLGNPASQAGNLSDRGKAGARRGLMSNIFPLRQRFAKGIRQLAEVTADHLSKMQLKLKLEIKSLKGPIYVWMPPPPGDRLWFSFVEPPQLVAAATPLVGGRLLKYSYQAGRVSQWIASKLQSSIIKNMVFPSCSDIPIPDLMGIDHPHVGHLPQHLVSKGSEDTEQVAKPTAPATAALEGEEPVPGDDRERPVVSKQAVVHTPAPNSAKDAVAKKSSPPEGSKAESIITGAGKDPGAGASESLEDVGRSKSSRRGFWGRRKASPPRKKPAPSHNEAAAHETELQAISKPTADKLEDAAESPDVGLQPSKSAGGHKSEEDLKQGSDASRGSESILKSSSLEAIGARLAPLKAAAQLQGDTETAPARDKASTPPLASSVKQRDMKTAERSSEDQSRMASAKVSSVEASSLTGGQTEGRTENSSSSPKAEEAKSGELKHEAILGQLPTASASAENAANSDKKNRVPDNPAVATSLNGEQQEPQETAKEGIQPSDVDLQSNKEATSDEQKDQSRDSKWTPAEDFLEEEEKKNRAPAKEASETLPAPSLQDKVSEIESSSPRSVTNAETPATSQPGGESPQSSAIGSKEAQGGRVVPGWQNRLAGTAMQKNWEAFKNRNPNTVSQGIKFAGAVEKLRGQAQEQLRKTQEQMRKQQELKRGPVQKPAQKEA